MNLKIKPLYFFLFLGLLFLEIGSFCTNVSFLGIYTKQIKFISYLLFICGIFLQFRSIKIEQKKILLIAFLLIISLLTYIRTISPIFVEILLVSFASLNLDFKKIIKYDIYIKLFIIVFLVILNQLGFAASDFIVTRGGETIRNSFGFYHPNTFGMTIMIVLFEFLYLQSENKLKLWHYILGISTILVISATSDTRTAMLCIAIYLIAILIQKPLSKIITKSFVAFSIKNLYLILLIFSITVTLLYTQKVPFAVKLNELLSNRIYLQSLFWEQYGISLLGNNIIYNRTLDNGFLKIFLNYGVLTSLFFVIVYWSSFKRSFKDQDYPLIIILIIFLLFSLSESSMFYVYNNLFLIYVLTMQRRKIIND